jgi:hypothetical protein
MSARAALRPLLAALVVLPLAVVPAGAQDAPDEPVEPRRYRGETQQNRPAALRTGTDGLVRRVRIAWVATRCRRERFRYASETVDTPPFDAVSATRLRDSYDYVERSRGGIRATVTATVVARRTGRGAAERWSGTFRAEVVVRRDGRRIDACRTRALRWNAALVG